MKKTAFALAVLLVCVLLVSCAKVANIPDTNATLVFKYFGTDIEATLNEEESKTIQGIFDEKRLFTDTPSCGFSEDVSIRFGDATFCIACDSCSLIQFRERFFSISDDDRVTINELFEKYGGHFPCV